MAAHPLVQLRTLQTLVEIGVDKNTMVVVPAPLVSTIQELTRLSHGEGVAAAALGNGEPVGPRA